MQKSVMQTNQCWSSPMWGHQLVSLMTKRWEVEIEEQRDMSESHAAAIASKAKRTRDVNDSVYRYLMKGPASTSAISKHLGFDMSWTRKVLDRMFKDKRITYKQQGHTKVWRIA